MTADAASSSSVDDGNDRDPRATMPLRTLLSPRASWFAPSDAAGLAVFRFAYGAIQLWEAVRYYEYQRIERYFVDSPFRFSYFGFGWVPMPPGDGIWWLYGIMAACAACVALGLFYRVAALGLFVSYTWTVLLEQSVYNNHYYLMSMLGGMLLFMPANAAWSADALLWRRDSHTATVPAWTYGLLRFQLGVVYFFGGVAKLNPDWMLHAQPMWMFLDQAVTESRWLPLWIATIPSAYVFAWGGLLLDLFIVPALLVRRTHALAYVVIVAFHLMNAHLFTIGVFPWMMIPATTIFFAPDWPRRCGRALIGRWFVRGLVPPAIVDDATKSATPAPAVLTPLRRALVALIVIHVALQVAIPLRHWAIPGDVAWTEEGHRFSWRMKLRRKYTESALVEARNPATDETSTTSGATWIKAHQVGVFTRPDMLIQLADYIARRYEDRLGWRDVEVRFYITVSLNGRPPRTIVDPTRDLAAVERTWWRSAGISTDFPPGDPATWGRLVDPREERRSKLNEDSPD